MLYLFLGLVALVAGLFAIQAFSRANPAVVALQLRRVAGGILVIAAAALLVRGLAGYAVPLGLLGWWLISGQGTRLFGGSARKSPGQTSRVATDHLEMELDHDTGALRGRILKGMFAGRDIESMRPAEMALLWQDCRFSDPQSAQLIEAYLDRIHPSWREDVARGEADMAKGLHGRMTIAEALEILGLEPGASQDDIRRAHRELMLKLHPDRGGSTYLAAKINEAKNVALEAGQRS